jgi:hypothetical protein
MPDVINDVVINYKSVGLDSVGSDIKQLETGLDGLVEASTGAEKATASLENRFQSLSRQFVDGVGDAEKYAKVLDAVNKAVAQDPSKAGVGAEILAGAAEKYGQTTAAVNAYAKAIETARGAVLGLAAGIGPLGAVLGSFGTWGVAAAAGIGLVSNALDYMKVNAEKTGDTAASLKTFSDSTGLTIDQVRGLISVGAEFGVSVDKVQSSLQKFTVNLGAARQGSGALYDQLRIVDKGLADDIAASHGDAEALDILGKAYNAAGDATTKAAIAVAAFGKGGAAIGGILGEAFDAGGIDGYSAAIVKATGVTSEWMKQVAALQTKNKELEEQIKLVNASIYTKETLDRQQQFLEKQLAIAKSFADMAKNPIGAGGLGAGAEQYMSGGGGLFGRPASISGAAASAADAAKRMDDAAAAGEAAKAEEALAKAKTDDINATIKAASESAALVAALGGEATAAEKEQARVDALSASFMKGTIDAETYARALDSDTARAAAQVTAIGQAWGDVSEKTALALQAAQNQLPVIQAVTGAEQQAAQYAADYANALIAGKQPADALALAASKLEASQAAATTSVEKQTQALKDSTAMIYARQQGTEATTAAAIAYRNAIDSGADSTAAAALKAATLANYMAQSATNAKSWAETMMGAAGRGWTPDQQYVATSFQSRAAGEPGSFVGGAGSPSGSSISLNPFASPYGYSGGQDISQSTSFTDQVAAAAAGGIQSALTLAMGTQARAPSYAYDPNAPGGQGAMTQYGVTESDIIGQVSSLYQIMNQQTTDKSSQIGNINSELAWLQSRPASVDQMREIATLRQSLDSLTKSTDSLNATNQDLLSPYYTMDPRTSHIGFRSQGMAAGGYVDVPGGFSTNDNMVATIPVASGERIYVDPMSARRNLVGGNTSISISSPIMIVGNPNPDQVGRTVFQNNQNLARSLRGALK